MILALSFVTPLLLLGLLATFIPFVLHLLSSVKAQEVFFPTLRFLRKSMEKTARRRRIQNLLLLLLRAGLLAALALSVAQPLSEATGGWLAGKEYAAVMILDNSFSMSAKDGGSARFGRAKAAANQLLHGESKPHLAALMVTNNTPNPTALTANIDQVRKQIKTTRLSASRAAMAPLVEQAVAMLAASHQPRQSIFFFSDLQRLSFDRMLTARRLAQEAGDVHFLIVNTASPEVKNVGVSHLEIDGQRVVNSYLSFTATLINSSATDRVVDVGLRVEGQSVGPLIRKTLRGTARAGGEGGGSSVTVTFRHRFTEAREFTGEVFIDQDDDLPADNLRRFHLKITGPVEALVVRGASDQVGRLGTDPVVMLNLALDPFGDAGVPWPIRTRILNADQLASTELAGKDAVFFCEVPSFTPDQAQALADFANQGGTVVFFLGPQTDSENYNRRFLPGGGGGGVNLLPASIEQAVGEIGPEAKARFVEKIRMTSPYIKGLYDSKDEAGYRSIQVQRYYRLKPRPGAEALLTMDNGDPLAVFRYHGKGRVVLVATTASPRWTTLAMNGLFLPMANRIALLARQQTVDRVFPAGAKVAIVPDRVAAEGDVFVKITPPPHAGKASEPVRVPLNKTASGHAVDYVAEQDGVYEWQLQSTNPDDDDTVHQFVVNPDREESDLRSFEADAFTNAMQRAGLGRVYVGDSLKAVDAAARRHAQGRNWWDILIALAIVALVAEAAVANRSHRKDEDLIPSHLNAKLAA